MLETKKKPQNLNPREGIAEQAQLDFSQYRTHIPKIVGLSCNRLQLNVKLIAADSAQLLKGLGCHSCRGF